MHFRLVVGISEYNSIHSSFLKIRTCKFSYSFKTVLNTESNSSSLTLLSSFSSNLIGAQIVLEYISDGLAYDLDSRIPKMAEEAMYAHLLYSIISTRAGQSEGVVMRFRRDRSAKLRNAKIRLSNIKTDEIVQTMRGKSKWLKF